MKPYAGVVNGALRAIFSAIIRLDKAELARIPNQGPLILVANHIHFIEVPVIRANLYPRDIIMLTKVQTYNNPLYNFLFHLWGGIPIERGVVDRAALQACYDTLAAGKILAVSPEGTRSGDGRLLPGKTGIVPLAVRSGAAILPVAHWGVERLAGHLQRFRRAPFHVRVGRPFLVETHGEGMSKEVRQRITDEIMFKLAELLPKPYHGAYPYPEQVVYRYLVDA